ncbi:uncharacterized protein LOC132716683 [Ruditapes philippinarum]|uniref:uncharacterized protein LOC132716683 n=1 Tax=Ruditapes philippinarum TaxID=129788 RepID=UPI00295C36D8|nr:uncharacterized protein LOC132716683 [Ruditapes philippinarum]XP_060555987.1 uncharacterized protein LOC132716683 [Ruditapes philippinarum]
MQWRSILNIIYLTIMIVQKARGRSPYLQNCGPSLECPEGYACLRPGFDKASTKARMKCYPCCCQDSSQCHFTRNRTIYCDCEDSGNTGACCEIMPTTSTTTTVPTSTTTTVPTTSTTITVPTTSTTTTVPTTSTTTTVPTTSKTTTETPTSATTASPCRANNCGSSYLSCSQPIMDCYVLDEADDIIVANSWSPSFTAFIPFVFTSVDCRNACLNTPSASCVAYSYNIVESECSLYDTTPADTISDANADLYILRCSFC